MICFAYTYKLNTQRQISYEAKKRKKEKKKKKPPNYLKVRCPPPFSTVGDESVVQHPHSGGWDNPFLYIFQARGCCSVVECSPSMPKAPNSIPALGKQKLKKQRGRSRRNSLVIRQFSLRTPKTDVHKLTARAPCWRWQLHNSLPWRCQTAANIALQPRVPVSLVQEGTLCYQKKNINTNPITNP